MAETSRRPDGSIFCEELDALLLAASRCAKRQKDVLAEIESLPGFIERFDMAASATEVRAYCRGWIRRSGADDICVSEVCISGCTRYFVFRGVPLDSARERFPMAVVRMVAEA